VTTSSRCWFDHSFLVAACGCMILCCAVLQTSEQEAKLRDVLVVHQVQLEAQRYSLATMQPVPPSPNDPCKRARC
jgi:hypothetical protein